MSVDVIITAVIFVITFLLIITERIHRTVAALAGGCLVVLLGILSQEEAFAAIDLNVIFLLAGMMVIANIMSETGVFQWLAVKAVGAGRGNPFAILAILSLITAGASALLDNVTVVVLVAPITLFVATTLRVSPVPFLVAEIMASNIGGAATIIGDPPNILIASAADYDFLTFVGNMGPISLLSLGILILSLAFTTRKELGTARVETTLDASGLITDPVLLRKSLVALALVLVGFIVHGFLHLEPATIALSGAVFLLLITGHDPRLHLREVEWTTLFFFIGLFILIQALAKEGIITWVAGEVMAITHGDLPLTASVVLWLSSLLSGVIDNIPYTATMIPVIQQLGQAMSVDPLWWALAMGADFGGNLTLVGASANLVVASVADKAGYPISFRTFLSYSVRVTILVMGISTCYLWVRYLIWR